MAENRKEDLVPGYDNLYCAYYTARVDRARCWFFAAILRSYEHLCFDRTYDVHASIFEFFVPHEQKPLFLSVMHAFEGLSVISDFQEHANRMEKDAQVSERSPHVIDT